MWKTCPKWTSAAECHYWFQKTSLVLLLKELWNTGKMVIIVLLSIRFEHNKSVICFLFLYLFCVQLLTMVYYLLLNSRNNLMIGKENTFEYLSLYLTWLHIFHCISFHKYFSFSDFCLFNEMAFSGELVKFYLNFLGFMTCFYCHWLHLMSQGSRRPFLIGKDGKIDWWVSEYFFSQ